MKTMSSTTRIAMATAALAAINVGLITFARAQVDQPASVSPPEHSVTQIDGPTDAGADDIRFEAIDVFVDSGDIPLAAYQFELSSATEGVEFVGIEGGEHAAFAEPPFYDPKAMNNSRVILAAFSTAQDLPKGRSRVARIHVQLKGPGLKEYQTKLAVSATSGGKEIPATVLISRAGK